ncbi:MAG: choice-of-anchor I family protein [Azonexus sp.]|nr:choice-of-anchor I family protein [Azonexus sp.]
MKKTLLAAAIAAALIPVTASAADPLISFTKQWTFTHSTTPTTGGQTSEITAFDAATNNLWVAGVAGIDILNASNGSLIQHIDTRSFGVINSVAIHNGVAALAIEAPIKTNLGTVQFYNTTTRANTGSVTVGALPDMLTFTPDGSKLLVANEGTPLTYGTRIGTTVPRNYGPANLDPAGSVSIIDMATRTVAATAGLTGVATTGSNIRTNTGMNYEPEYITVNAAGTTAWVALQEANAVGVLDLSTNSFSKIVGLGAKDFSLPGNQIDPLNNGTVSFGSYNVKGLYMPDGIAAYNAGGKTFVVMANEGDFREDDGDRSAASSLGATGDLANLRVLNTDSSPGNLFAAGARSFSIRDADGNLVYDSGNILDKEAAARGIYDDGRSRDKGVEPEGVALHVLAGRQLAFIGLERTLKGAVAIFDVTDPHAVTFLDMIVTAGDLAPEGLTTYTMDGISYLAIANETSGTTTVYSLAAVPEPETYAMMLAGLGLIGFAARRRKQK